MSDSEELSRLLSREDLAPQFERWRTTLAPGEERPTSGEEWAGALVLVERGALEVDCLAGGHRTFIAGDLLVLGLLPMWRLRNRGPSDVRLLAVRRAGDRQARPFLRVVRRQCAGHRSMTNPPRRGLISITQQETIMFRDSRAFSSFSVDDLEAARRFYGETLGLKVSVEDQMGMLVLHLAGGGEVMLYAKPDHAPATFTVLNFNVDDIDSAVDQLAQRGVGFERYEGFEQDERGIARPASPDLGPPIAWLTDPAGNVIAVLQEP